jgi:hypothetical protein
MPLPKRPLFAVDIACPLFDYSLGWPSAPVMPLPGGRAIVLGLLLVVSSLLFLRCICRLGAILCPLSGPRGMIPADMMPLPALVPAAAIIPLTATLPRRLRRLPGLL